MTILTDRVDALFSTWDKPDSPGCVLAVIKDGEFIHKRGYGMADLERGTRITPDTVFDLGSTGKQFTATVIAILAAQEQLSLDDPIRKHLPEMPSYADEITVRHLIHHTSGLRDYLTLMDIKGLAGANVYPEEFLYDLIASQKRLNYPPGKEIQYTNSGYFLLGFIARRIAGKHITELIAEYILEPLGMNHTTFNNDYRRIVRNRAMSYDAGELEGAFMNNLALCGGFGDGAILSNVEDLLLWDRNFYRNKLNNAQPDLIEQLHVTGKLNNGKSTTYAFGLVVDQYRGLKCVSHGGSWAGYRTEMMRFPVERLTVICISNLSTIDPTTLCYEVADILLEEKMGSSLASKTVVSSEKLEQYTGIYQGKNLTLEIVVNDGALQLLVGAREYQLQQSGRKRFRFTDSPDALTFSGRNNEYVRFTEYGIQSEKYRRIRGSLVEQAHLSIYEGDYYCRELEAKYTIARVEDGLQIIRNRYDAPFPLTAFTEDTLVSKFGELRFRFQDGIIKGFSLHADRVANLKFQKVQ